MRSATQLSDRAAAWAWSPSNSPRGLSRSWRLGWWRCGELRPGNPDSVQMECSAAEARELSVATTAGVSSCGGRIFGVAGRLGSQACQVGDVIYPFRGTAKPDSPSARVALFLVGVCLEIVAEAASSAAAAASRRLALPTSAQSRCISISGKPESRVFCWRIAVCTVHDTGRNRRRELVAPAFLFPGTMHACCSVIRLFLARQKVPGLAWQVVQNQVREQDGAQ